MRTRSRLAQLSGAAGLLLASTAVAVATGTGPARATVVNASAAGGFPNQARLVGSIQYSMVIRDVPTAVAALREHAPTDDRLRAALERRQRSGS
ncbi:hypothetical protein [Plantactinospora sp. B24E8]|uniref:hypothetical protein n=1 Tax=Plantactinospora sp. B24E8 TaxID=3153567 RepID=UPI00325F8942